MLPYIHENDHGSFIYWVYKRCYGVEGATVQPGYRWVMYHNSHVIGVSVRCWTCKNCLSYYRGRIYGKALTKFALVAPDQEGLISLWTLGTSMEDDFETLQRYWRKFTKIMQVDQERKSNNWNPIFRVYENGSKGGRSHIHFIHLGFLDHGYVLKKWRTITGENSNVNFRAKYSGRMSKSLLYCLKYVSKDHPKYSFLGSMYKAKLPKYTASCDLCKSDQSDQSDRTARDSPYISIDE